MLGYTFRYQLFVYSCNSCLISSFMLLCSYPSVVCLSWYLVILWQQFILLLFYAHCLYARALPFTHTLTRSLSDDPGFARSDIGRFVSIVQVFVETVRFAKSWSFSLFDFGILIFLPSYYFLILVISDSVVIPVFILWYHAWMLIWDIAVIMIYYSLNL